MTHADLIKTVVAVHSSVLLVAIAAYYKYGDRTDVFTRSLEGTDGLLRRIRQQLASDLGESLVGVFRDQGTVPSPILRPDGGTYIEQCTNPIGGERYKESIRDFVEESNEVLADYRSAIMARASWCFWAKCLSWTILGLTVWQAVVVGSSALLDWVCSIPIPDWVLQWAGLPTVLIVAACFVAVFLCLRHHDTIQRMRMRYDTP